MPSGIRPRHALAAVLLTATLGLAGCSGADGGAASSAAKDSAAGAPRPGEAAAGPDAGYGRDDAAKQPGKPAAVQQHIIRTAEVFVEVKDASKALARARAAAAAAGGHIANESTERVGEGGMTSTIVLRVPQTAYEDVLKELSGAGKLLSRKADAKDVTDQVVDVESRIATQRASVARVRELMDRATKLEDVVTLESQLSSRQAELESLLAQQAALKDRTTLATITLRLSEPEPVADVRKDEEPGVPDALKGGWDALVTTAKWVAIVLAALAPWLAVLLVAYVLWRLLVRPFFARRAARRPAPAPAVPPHPAPAGGPAGRSAWPVVPPRQAPAPAGEQRQPGAGEQPKPEAGDDGPEQPN
ncbi:DUF4349 domain-containing protein [Streptomyces coeruleoprunus]|uniref:DUF4349 domain-containing protein n=1 Tax=Streptomyces coeruleoprunus TaxID=285563 RepID=A0ABV9XGQ7_9ACTN